MAFGLNASRIQSHRLSYQQQQAGDFACLLLNIDIINDRKHLANSFEICMHNSQLVVNFQIDHLTGTRTYILFIFDQSMYIWWILLANFLIKVKLCQQSISFWIEHSSACLNIILMRCDAYVYCLCVPILIWNSDEWMELRFEFW